MRVEKADVVVVGGGAAGLSAALEAVERLSTAGREDAVVALVSKVYPMRSHTVAAEGGAAGVVGSDDSLERHVADTVRGGAGLCEEDAVRFVVERAPRELARLERLGMPWSRADDGRPAVRRFGGMSRPRTWFAADKTGFHLLHTLFQTSLRYDAGPSGGGIRRYDEHVVLDLLLADGHAEGVVAYDQHRGETVTVLAPAVVLATGGAGRVYATSTNAGGVTGDGIALALRAGLPLRDLEFMQVHPTGLPGSGILLTEAARGEGGLLLDAQGRRFLADYGLGPETPPGAPEPLRMELGPRDKVSQAIWRADRDGRTVPTPDGGVVHLDLRHLGRAVIDDRLPLVAALSRRYAGVDPVTDLVPVRPTAHYLMGGILTDARGIVPGVRGLFAAGECGSTGLHGANRLGSNSLVETLVVGRASGELAADVALSELSEPRPHLYGSGSDNSGVELARALAEPWLTIRGRGTEPPAELRAELGSVMDADVGIFRDADGLVRAAARLDELAGKFADVRVADTSPILNTDWSQAVELGAMLDVARAMVAAARVREESRGAHQRLDHPRTDAAARHSLVARGPDGALMVTHAGVGDGEPSSTPASSGDNP